MGENNIIATCHVSDCSFWQNEHCLAQKIQVDVMQDHADCMTYNKESD